MVEHLLTLLIAGVAIKKGGSTADIISPNWVLECIEDNELLPLTKRFAFSSLPSSRPIFTPQSPGSTFARFPTP